MSVPGPKLGSSPPAALVRTTIRAPSALNSSTAGRRGPGGCPRTGGTGPGASPPAGRRGGRAAAGRRARVPWPRASPGSSANGMATASSRSSARPPRPDPSTMPTSGDEVRSGPTAAASASMQGRLVGRRDGTRRVDGIGRVRHAGLQERVQGIDGRGPRLRRPDGSIDTGMPITSRRARTRTAGRGETAARRGQRSARSDRRWNEESLM